MARGNNEIRYKVGLDIDESGINRLKNALQELSKIKLTDIEKTMGLSGSEALTVMSKVRASAQDLQVAVSRAFNPKLNTINIDKFNESLRSSNTNIKEIYKNLTAAGQSGQAAFRHLANELTKSNYELKQSTTLLDKMATTLTNTVKWNIASNAINSMTRSVEQAWGYTKSLDGSLNDIRIVTGKSADEMARFAVQANDAAKALGKTTTDYTKAALIYAQQGLSDEEVKARATITLKAANVTGQSADEVSEQLTAVWNGYKASAEEAEIYVDRLAAIAATTASNLEELSVGMSKVASAAAAMGVNEEQLAAQISTIISATRQAPESVGTALRTVYARISDIKAGVDEEGVSLGNYSQKMADLGINVLDVNGKLRDMGSVMEEIGGKWAGMTREQQVSLAQTMAGQRQYSNLIALFDNFENYQKALKTAQDSAGTLQKQQDTYMESLSARLEVLTASLEDVYDSLVDIGTLDVIKNLVDLLSQGATAAATLIDNLGGGKNILGMLASVAPVLFSTQIARGVQTQINNKNISDRRKEQFAKAAEEVTTIKNLDDGSLDQKTRDLLNDKERLYAYSDIMPAEQFDAIQKNLDKVTELSGEMDNLDVKIQKTSKDYADFAEQYKDFQSLEDSKDNIYGLNTEQFVEESEQYIEKLREDASQTIEIIRTLRSEVLSDEEVENIESEEANLRKEIEALKSIRFQLGGDKLKNALTIPSTQVNQYSDQIAFRNDLAKRAMAVLGEDYVKNLVANIKGVKGNPKWRQEIQVLYNAVGEELKKREEELAKKIEALNKSAEKARELNGELAEHGNEDVIIQNLEKKIKELQEARENLIKEIEAQDQAARDQKEAERNEQLDALGESFEGIDFSALVETVTSLTGGLASISISISQIGEGLHKIWSDKDTDFMEKIEASIPLLATTLPILITSIYKMGTALNFVKVQSVETAIANGTLAASNGALAISYKNATLSIKAFNKAISINPVLLAIAAAAAALGAFHAVIQSCIDSKQDIIDSNAKEIESLNELTDKYKNQQDMFNQLMKLEEDRKNEKITINELYNEVEKLTEKYDLEAEAIERLKKAYSQDFRKGILEEEYLVNDKYIKELEKQKGLIESSIEEEIEKYQLENKQFDFQDVFFKSGAVDLDETLIAERLANIESRAWDVSVGWLKIAGIPLSGAVNPGIGFNVNTAEEQYNLYKELLKAKDEFDANKELYNVDNSEIYKEMRKWLQDVAPLMEKYEENLKLINEESNKQIGINAEKEGQIDFSDVDSFKDFFNQRDQLRKIYEDAGKDAELADAYIRQRYAELNSEYSYKSFSYDNIRKESTIEDAEELVDIIDQLDDVQLSIVNQLDFKNDIEYWDQFKGIIEYIQNADLSNLNTVETAAEDYNKYSSLKEQINSSKKKTISKKEYEGLNSEVQKLFSSQANGQYKMTASQGVFENAMDTFALAGFEQNKSVIGDYIKNLQKVQTMEFKNLSKVASSKGSARNQLDYLKATGFDSNILKAWEATLEGSDAKSLLESDFYEKLAENVNKVGDKFDTLDDALQYQMDLLKENDLAIARSAQSYKELDELLEKGSISVNDYNKAWWELDNTLDTEALDYKELKDYSKYLQEVAKETENLDDDLEENAIAAQVVAKGIMKMNDAIDTLADNWEEWSDVLKKSSKDSEEYANAISETKKTIAQLLDISEEAISNDFIAEHLDEITQAATGSEIAIDSLKESLSKEIINDIVINVDDEYLKYVLEDIEYLQTEIPDLKVGATLDDEEFLKAANRLIASADLTVAQTQDLFDSLGYEPTFATVEQTVTSQKPIIDTVTDFIGETWIPSGTRDHNGNPMGEMKPVTRQYSFISGYKSIDEKVVVPALSTDGVPKIKSITKKATGSSNSYSSSNAGGKAPGKSSKSGSSSKPSKKDKEKPIEDDRDIYHDINIEIAQVTRNLERVQKVQERLFGKDLIDNLNKQISLLDKQTAKLKEKQKLQEWDLKRQQEQLKLLGVTFNEYGDIANYMSILAAGQEKVNAATEEYNKLVESYNAMGTKDEQEALEDRLDTAKEAQKNAEDEYKKLEEKIKNYDSLRVDMEDLVDELTEITQKEVEINIQKFRMKVEISLEMGEARRDWNEFKRKVLDKDNILHDSSFNKILKDANLNLDNMRSYFDTNGVSTISILTDQITQTRQEIALMDKGMTSAIYGDNKAKAMEDLKSDLQELMSQMIDIEELVNSIDQAYLDTIEDAAELFNKQVESYEYIGELIQHDMNLLTMIYGNKNFDAMEKYYNRLEENNLKEIDFLKKQADYWKEQWENALDENDKKAFEQHYKDTINSLNSLVESSIKTLQDGYINSIEKIYDELEKKLTNGKGLDYLQTEWDLMNKNADRYLDTINTAYAIRDTESKYNKAINDTKSVKNQQALKTLMDEQLAILRNKEKVSQYDVDRAEKLLQVEQARIALEEAKNAKSTMRLKRDSQGNYSYQYVADEDNIAEAEDRLAAARNDLYNFDKARFQQVNGEILADVQDYLNQRKALEEDFSLSQEERIEKIKLLEEQYGEDITTLAAYYKESRVNLTQSAFWALEDIYDESYDHLSEIEKDKFLDGVVPMWETGVTKMAEQILGKDGNGFQKTCTDAFDKISEATRTYENQLKTLAQTAGTDIEKIKTGVGGLATELSRLIQANNDAIQQGSDEIQKILATKTAVDELKKSWNSVYRAAKDAVKETNKFIEVQNTAAATADTTAKNASSDIKNSVPTVVNTPAPTSSGNGGGATTPGTSANSIPTSPTALRALTSREIEGIACVIGFGGNNAGGWGYGAARQALMASKLKQKDIDAINAILNEGPDAMRWRLEKWLSENNEVARKTFYASAFASGGYTGDWIGDGRLALLHQKELVLNQQDTANILDAVNTLRTIMSSMNGTMNARLGDIRNNARTLFDNTDSIEQTVHIDATFPNVDSKKEIEEAFNELVNLAAQRALKNRK